MAASAEHKLFLGPRLKRLRRDLALTQSRMAEDLGVSPSYLNHLERNQRPLTAQILLRLARTYDVDVRHFSGEGDEADARDLAEVLADPMFRDLAIPRHEVTEVAREAPGVADALLRLYRAVGDERRSAPASGEGASPASRPSRWVGDYVESQRNFFPELDEAASALAAELSPEPQRFAAAARARLSDRHGVQARITAAEAMPDTLRRYDHHRRRILLSERLSPSGRAFALGYQLALFEHADLIASLVEKASPPDAVSGRLLTVSLGNYAAAAAMMPYEPFRLHCEAVAFDLDRVALRFGASYEQVCHRLTTLSRPSARGIPFFMVRTDAAGNLSKRFAAGPYPFSRLGGLCPRWRLHAAFRSPGVVLTEIIEDREGARYFTILRAVPRAASGLEGLERPLAIGLGCELKFAGRLGYARGLDLAAPVVTEVGPACRVCDRPACAERAAEPYDRSPLVEPGSKSLSSFPFV